MNNTNYLGFINSPGFTGVTPTGICRGHIETPVYCDGIIATGG